jgi:hypothetical protein
MRWRRIRRSLSRGFDDRQACHELNADLISRVRTKSRSRSVDEPELREPGRRESEGRVPERREPEQSEAERSRT